MDVYTIHKADTMASGQNVPDVWIHINAKLPGFYEFEQLKKIKGFKKFKEFYQQEAANIYKALKSSLPEGTLHELLILMSTDRLADGRRRE